MTDYTCHARAPSTLRNVAVHREKSWPRGATGHAPDAPRVPGQGRRGPQNVLVADAGGKRYVVPHRTLRRILSEYEKASMRARNEFYRRRLLEAIFGPMKRGA